MESCRNRLCHITVNFIESFFKLLISPFRLDKMFAIAGVSLVASPTIFNFEGEFILNEECINGFLSFTNQADMISYITGGTLIVLSVFLYRKKELDIDTDPQQSLLKAIANQDTINRANIQFTFSSAFKYDAGINQILYLLDTNNPSLAIRDYKRARGLVCLKEGFELKEKIDLENEIKYGTIQYFFMTALAVITYIVFIGIMTHSPSIESMSLLALTIVFGFIAYLGLDKSASGYSAKRLISSDSYA